MATVTQEAPAKPAAVSFPRFMRGKFVENDVGPDLYEPVPWMNLIARFQQPAMFIRTRWKYYMGMVGCAGNLSDMSQRREGRFAGCHYRKAVARYMKGVSLIESRHGLTWCGVGSLFCGLEGSCNPMDDLIGNCLGCRLVDSV